MKTEPKPSPACFGPTLNPAIPRPLLLALVISSLLSSFSIFGQGTAFTDQGRADENAPRSKPPMPGASTTQAIPWSEVGEKATAQYSGDGLTITATTTGATLNCVFQKLKGEATRDGLWLSSTASNMPASSFRVVATSLGRAADLASKAPLQGAAESAPAYSQVALAKFGEVSLADKLVRFTRPGLVEEYSVSVDGVRQDFIVEQRPAGSAALRLELEVSGAEAEPLNQGARLVLGGSGRKLAYNRLRATDATRRELTARIEIPTARRLAVLVEDTEAVYPVRIDPTFSDVDWVSLGSFPGPDNAVRAAVVDDAGNLYVGGYFGAVGDIGANSVAKWDGSSWSALGSGINVGVWGVTALAVSGTNLYAGGDFTTAGGVAASRIAKWNGSSWSALGTGMNSTVWALAVSGTNLYAGGDFTAAGPYPSVNYIAKWDGSSWSPVGSGVGGSVSALAVSGTNLYVGGGFGTAGGIAANYIAKWNGSSWSPLGSGVNGYVHALAVSGTNLYAAGEFTTAGGVTAYRIAKWNGSSWSGLGYLDAPVESLAVSGTNLYVGGDFSTAGGVDVVEIARWNGSTWSAVGAGASGGGVLAVAVSGTNVYVGGQFTAAGGLAANKYLARWDGSNYSTVGAPPSLLGPYDGEVRALAASGTDLYVGGYFTTAGGVVVSNVAKWNGNSWSALGSGMNDGVKALAVSGTNLYAGGAFTTAGGVAANHIAKWDGTSWSPLGPGVSDSVSALAVSGSDLYAGGIFSSTGDFGMQLQSIAKWNGLSWSAMGSGMSINSTVRALAASGTNLYAGGDFTTAGGSSASRIAKWNGSSWAALGSGLNNAVWAVAVSGSDLYAGGQFTTAGGIAANYIAKWNGSSWSALGSGMTNNSGVYALAVSSTNLYAGGQFTTAGGISASRIAKWNGSSWSALGSGLISYSCSVEAMAVSGSDLFVGGWFAAAGGKGAANVARAAINGLAPTDISLSASSVAENQASGTAIGILSATDPDIDESQSYTLVGGTGGGDNSAFTILGSQLRTAAMFDYETKNSYSIRVRATDSGGGTFEKAFAISVVDVNEAPTDIALGNASVAENQPVGTVVGNLGATDQDIGDTHTFTLVNGAGGIDNGLFTIAGNQLQTGAVFDYETRNSYSIRVRATDSGSLTFEKIFTVTVTGVNEAPTDIALSNLSVAENQPSGTAVGNLSATDPDAGDTAAFTLVNGVGSSDNGSFTIVENQLRTAAEFDYEAKNSYNIRVRVTDSGGLTFEKAFSVAVTDVNEAPTAQPGGPYTIIEGQSLLLHGEGSSDPDAGDSIVSHAWDLNNDGNFGEVSGSAPSVSYALLANLGLGLGAHTIGLKVTDTSGLSGTNTVALTINCGTITVSPSSLPAGIVGTAYSNQLNATGGWSSYGFSITEGALPAGLSLSSAGLLSGTPSAGNTFVFTVQATDTNGCSGSQIFTQTVACPNVTFSPATLPAGVVGAGFGTRLAGANGSVYAAVAEADGKVVIGGDFTIVNGFARHYLAQLNPDGTVVNSFDPNPDDGVFSIVVQPDGKLLIAGRFTTLNGALHYRIARLESNGNVDATFDPGNGPDDTVVTMALNRDNCQILLGGWFNIFNGTTRHRIARLDSHGNLDTGFDPGSGPDDIVQSLALQLDGQVVIGGRFTTVTGVGRNHIARLNSSGSLDASFNPGAGADGLVNAVALQSGGRVIIGGQFGNFNATPRPGIARLDDHGALDTSFDPGTGVNGGILNAVAVEPDGYVVIAGYMSGYNGTPRNGIARVDNHGNLDGSFDPGDGISDFIETVSIQSDGKVLVGGHFTTINHLTRNHIGRLNHDGSLDEGYDQVIAANGANDPHSFTVSGNLPPGLNLSTDGILSGTATTPGSYSFTISEADLYGCVASNEYTVVIDCPASVVFGPATLPNGFGGVAYLQMLSVSGGAGPYTFSVAAGNGLPTGLTLSPEGRVSGTPSGGGSSTFTVAATDAYGCLSSHEYTLNIDNCPAITLSPSSLPDGTFGSSYSQTLTPSGGVAPYTFGVSSGAPSAGLGLGPAGLLSGTPTAVGPATFTVTATDANGCPGSRTYTLTINCPAITLSPSPLPDGTLGNSYSQTITASGGAGGYTFTKVAGTLPPGLSLSNGGLLSGTPTSGGGFSFTVRATDSNGCTGQQDYAVFIIRTCIPSFEILHAFSSSGGDGWGTKYGLIQGPGGFVYGVTLRGGSSDAGTIYRIAPDGAYSTWVSLAWNNSNNLHEPYFSSGPLVQASDGNLYGFSESGGDFSLGTIFKVTSSGTLTKLLSLDGNSGGSPLGHGLLQCLDSNLYGTLGNTAIRLTLGGTLTSFATFDSPVTGGAPGDLIRGSDGNLYGTTRNGGPQNQGTIFKLPPSGQVTVVSASVPNPADKLVEGADGNLYAECNYEPGLSDGALFRVSPDGTTVSRLYTFTFDDAAAKGANPTGGLIHGPDGSFYGVTQGGGSGSAGTVFRFTPPNTLEVVHHFVGATEGSDPPGGLLLASDGKLYGVTNERGPGNQGAVFRITLGCPSLALLPLEAPGASVGVSYMLALSADNGAAPYSYGITSGTLPVGLSLANGIISGIPTAAGNCTFTIRAVDSQGNFGSRSYTIVVGCPVVALTPPSPLPYGTVGNLYSQTISVNGVNAQFNFAQSGTLPPGLVLSAAGVLSGTPTALGDYTFTIQASDPYSGQCSGSQNYLLQIAIILDLPLPQPDGSVQFSVHVEPGRTYTIQSSLDLITWHDLTTFTATGPSQTVNDLAPDPKRGYYRVVLQN